jgi:crotonobetainyl-CoA:carnitine CoA-transferase CaiB-like acyl-CoA transferase
MLLGFAEWLSPTYIHDEGTMTKPQPLAGIRVVEFVHMVMGPSCGLILADLGADVIKVEPVPDGDNTRRLVGGASGFFINFNRNKRSLAVDMKSKEGRDAVLRLLGTADVVTENFRPGALDKLGFGFKDLSALNPRLVYCSLKGFLSGPYQERTALDEVVQMMGGLAYMTGPLGRPLRAGTSVNDIMGGMFAVIAILAALRERDTPGPGRGKGQQLTSSLFENCAFLSSQHMAAEAITGTAMKPFPERTNSAWGVYDIFETKEKSQLFVAIVTDTQFQNFCDEFGQAEMKADAAFATNNSRVAARPRLMPALREILLRHTKSELMERFEKRGISYAPINTPSDLFDDPHLQAGGLLPVELPDGRTAQIPGLPMEFAGERLPLRRNPPLLGEHGPEILAELGYAKAEIEAMQARGVLVTVPARKTAAE